MCGLSSDCRVTERGGTGYQVSIPGCVCPDNGRLTECDRHPAALDVTAGITLVVGSHWTAEELYLDLAVRMRVPDLTTKPKKLL